MSNFIFLPQELESVIDKERIDFSVLSKRKKPLKESMGLIFFGIVWTAFTSIFVVAFLGPSIKEGTFSVRDILTDGNLEDPQSMLVPFLIIAVFLLVGIGILLGGFYSFFQKGGYFVGTADRLLRYHKGKIFAFDWEQFSGNMVINYKRGDITLQLRTGRMVNSKNSSAQYVPDVVHILGVTNVLDIEKICRKRIKENDPTPANTINNR